MPRVFQQRVPELLSLEGWYEEEEGQEKFKFSCRFNDILRCSEFNGKTKHFTSCFKKGGLHEEQPRLRCLDPTWALIFVPDKHGNFVGRCFVRWTGGKLSIGKVYGNKIDVEKIKHIMIKLNVDCLLDQAGTYLPDEPG